MFPKRFFISGTGTDVGKTVISAALAHGLTQLNKSVTYWKPVQAGFPEDADTLRAHGGKNLTIHPNGRTFTLPASPDQAAEAEGIDGPMIIQLQKEARAIEGEVQLIEGAGGVFVPLNHKPETWADFLTETGLPTVITAHSGLGTLNHTTLTVKALQQHHVPILGVVLNGPLHEANMASLGRMFPEIPLHAFPYLEGLSENEQWSEASKALAEFVAARASQNVSC